MKILFVASSDSFDFFRLGGIEATIKQLVLFLIEKKHNVTIYQIDTKKEGLSEIKTEYGIVTIHYGTIFNIRRKLLTNRYDIINFIRTPFEDPFFTLLFLCKKIFSKMITTKFFFTYPPIKKYTFFQSFKYNWLIDKCFTFSKRLMKEAKLKTNDVCFLFPPVADHFFNLNKKKKLNDKIRIMYLGRLSKDKGLDLIINIYQNLDRNKYCLGISGYFVNSNDKLFYIEKLNSLKIDQLNIIDRKIKSSFGVHPSFDNCDILLLPYQDLTPTLDLPLLILEGMVSGCKVITSCIGDIPFLNGNIYCIENFRDPQQFMAMIEKVASENVKQYNYDDFSMKSIGQKYLKFLIQKQEH